MPPVARTSEGDVLAAARRGDETAFRLLIEPLAAAPRAHCYRMLGTPQDADDALQDTLLRAWRGLDGFQAGRPLRPWLYRIATNVCLDAIAQRPRLRLPTDDGQPAAAHEGAGTPLTEGVWIEPIADRHLTLPDDDVSPVARYEQRETLELAFLAALQHLPGNQRAALLLRVVLGFSAREVAELLDTSTASITSALQRARTTLEERVPPSSQQQTLRALGDAAVAQLVHDYVDALETGDVARLTRLLSDDVTFSMPPSPAGGEAARRSSRSPPPTTRAGASSPSASTASSASAATGATRPATPTFPSCSRSSRSPAGASPASPRSSLLPAPAPAPRTPTRRRPFSRASACRPCCGPSQPAGCSGVGNRTLYAMRRRRPSPGALASRGRTTAEKSRRKSRNSASVSHIANMR